MLDRITVEPDKMGGQACIRGYRFTVSQLVRLVAAGRTADQIRDEYAFIQDEDIQQALLYAAQASESHTFPLREPA